MIQRLSALCGLFVVIAALMGCAEKSEVPEGKTEIKFLTMQLRPTFDEFFFQLIDEYERENPDIHITWVDFPYDGYNMKLMTSFMSDQAPDVINFSSEDVKMFIDAGYVEPLDEHLGEEKLEIYVDSIMEGAAVFDGQTYLLPWYASSVVNFANMELVREAGLTEEDVPIHNEDLEEFCRIIKERTGKWGVYPLYTEHATMKTHLLEGNVPLFNKDYTEAVFNTPQGRRVFSFWIDLYKDGLVPRSALTVTHRNPLELYKTGELALLTTGPQFSRKIKGDAPTVFENTKVYPQTTWREYGAVHFVALHMMGVSSLSDHKSEAAAFAHFVTNARNQLAFAKEVTIIPSTVESLKDPYFTESDGSIEGNARVISAAQTLIGKVFRPPEEARKLYSIMETATEEAALGETPPDEAIEYAEKQWNEILARQ